jgi:hypothetical protein
MEAYLRMMYQVFGLFSIEWDVTMLVCGEVERVWGGGMSGSEYFYILSQNSRSEESTITLNHDYQCCLTL